jgi:NAD(P)H dehydrogenase (quinone)
MHAHIVLAHPEPRSFNAHLGKIASLSLQAQGWTTSVSDLHANDFDPCERREHYGLLPSQRFDVQAEQRRASDEAKIPAEVRHEIASLDPADLLILQYPMWWHLPPAMMKGWMDRVLIYGEVYASQKRFEKGRFLGKRAMILVTVATGSETYDFNGRSGDIDLLLWPVHFSLAYVGFTVLEPFIAYGVESGLRYSDDSVLQSRLEKVASDLGDALAVLNKRPNIPFNRMAEWGGDGRIVPSAQVHSPFIRHRRHLQLT